MSLIDNSCLWIGRVFLALSITIGVLFLWSICLNYIWREAKRLGHTTQELMAFLTYRAKRRIRRKRAAAPTSPGGVE